MWLSSHALTLSRSSTPIESPASLIRQPHLTEAWSVPAPNPPAFESSGDFAGRPGVCGAQKGAARSTGLRAGPMPRHRLDCPGGAIDALAARLFLYAARQAEGAYPRLPAPCRGHLVVLVDIPER